MNSDIAIMVAGAAGQGMQTIGAVLGKVFVRGGCEVFALQDNMSRIRGGHNFFQIRASRNKIMAASMPLEILIALNEESVGLHRDDVAPHGIVLFDSERDSIEERDERFLGIPLERLADEKGGNKIFSNSVATGVVLALLGWDFDLLEGFLKEYFSTRPDTVEGNVKAARAGYETALSHEDRYHGPKIEPRKTEPKMFINGHEAVALGALAAGCQFMIAYPMSPSTSIMIYLAGKADDFNMVVEQAEDEIAAVNMAIGASYAGIRSLTATSGGGFSLMVEAFGLAGVSEIPLVLIEAQRPGPATGLPTRTQQGDLLFILHAAQDEFPRAVFTPGTPREAFYQTIKAFDLAEKYQIPAVVLTDQYLADSYFTEEKFDLTGIEINRHLLGEADAKDLKDYKRYAITDSGVSPRSIPSAFGLTVAADSHEHDEYGHITEDAGIRRAMVEKRFRKLIGLGTEIAPPREMGDPQADLLLVSWGSTYGPVAEAIDILNNEGIAVKGIHLSEMWPFPKDHISPMFEGVKKWAVVENNYTGQLARLFQMELQKTPDGNIRKYTGRPFLPGEIVTSVKKEVVER
jgi:2-oxoglutarate ferredoxin oxidoreductase subunit alpha